ncbi:MAG: alpha/beta hydrolase [Planctomycetia bacterium]|nr:alpha/beta hydrolase [Planctomycetia bacterium]
MMTFRRLTQTLFMTGCFFMATIFTQAAEICPLWPGLAPGETEKAPHVESAPGQATRVTSPELHVFVPENKTSTTCMLILPGGGYGTCFYASEGFPNAKFWNDRGMTAFVLVYRVPRPVDKPIYLSAWQDAQRAVRYIRAHAEQYGLDPEKIGVQGYSAGGNLTLLTALNSQTPAYDPVDELDKVPCHVNFAIPIYPAYVLDDGAADPNQNKGQNAKILDCFHFDEKTPPLCLVHGDNDIYSPLGSIAVYQQLHTRGIPCEMHIYSGAVHGFMYWDDLANAKSWQDRCADWVTSIGF